jgi:hypothetical protein
MATLNAQSQPPLVGTTAKLRQKIGGPALMKNISLQYREPENIPDAPPRTCLVIDAENLDQLYMDDRALCISLLHENVRLFPLRRLARIHVMGEINTGMNALIHCAEQQIPVAFFSRRGKLRCQLYYPVFQNGILGHWLEHVEFDQQVAEIYESWLTLQQLHILSQIGVCDGAPEARIKRTKQRLHELLNTHWGKGNIHEAHEWLNGILFSHLSQLAMQHGLANQSRCKRKLLEDLLPISELWMVYLLAVSIIEKKQIPELNAKGMSRFYQNHSINIEYMISRMLSQLVSRMEAIV